MLTVLVAAKRLPSLSLEAFTHYWLNRHAPLVLSTPGFTRYLRRYVIYPLLGASDDGDFVLGKFPGYGGIGEIRFDSADAMKQALRRSGLSISHFARRAQVPRPRRMPDILHGSKNSEGTGWLN
jgi:uncharacterized protein (TIGR02118 family)